MVHVTIEQTNACSYMDRQHPTNKLKGTLSQEVFKRQENLEKFSDR
jgi:hypothetical protein